MCRGLASLNKGIEMVYKTKVIDLPWKIETPNDLPKVLAKEDSPGWELCGVIDRDGTLLLIYRKTSM